MNENKLSVHLYGERIGILEKLESKKLHFTYKKEATCPLSLSMPIKEQVFDHRHCKPFFAGLLPEITRTRRALGRTLGSDESDIFCFLKDMGQECAGAISFHEMTMIPLENKPLMNDATILNNKQLKAFLHSIPARSLLQTGTDLKTILSGENDKSQICLVENKIALAPNNGLTTHIIKPGLQENHQILNEYVCLKIAKEIGLHVVEVSLGQLGDIHYLVIPRYDRKINAQHQIECLHQEDFCQALGVSPARKKESDGGPGFKDIFTLLNKTVIPAISRNRLVESMIVNYLIGNSAAHAKHFSLCYSRDMPPGLAPLYGLRCYYEAASLMAMKIGSTDNNKEITPSDWQLFCKQINYTYPAFKKILFDLMEKSVNAAHTVKTAMKAQNLPLQEANNIAAFIEKQCEQTAKRYERN